MKRIATFFIVAVAAGLFASTAKAQGTNAWAAGYPQPGTASGSIDVQGKLSPDSSGGWGAVGSPTVSVWLVGSGEVTSVAISFNTVTGNWQGTVSNLTPGATYNVVVQATVTNAQQQQASIATDPAQATAKD